MCLSDYVSALFKPIIGLTTIFAVAIIVAATTITLGCATSPTGRKQARFLPEAQLDAMGAQSFAEIKKKTPISTDRALTNKVNCVVKTLLDRNGFNANEWEVQVFRDNSVNDFAVPGKKNRRPYRHF